MNKSQARLFLAGSLPATHGQVPVIVPGWNGDKKAKYSIYLVDFDELNSFLPPSSIKSTDNFYAAQTFIEGFIARQNRGES